MNAKKENIQELTFLADELKIQIALLSTKKAETELKAKEYSKELESLKAKQHGIIHDLHQLETQATTYGKTLATAVSIQFIGINNLAF